MMIYLFFFLKFNLIFYVGSNDPANLFKYTKSFIKVDLIIEKRKTKLIININILKSKINKVICFL